MTPERLRARLGAYLARHDRRRARPVVGPLTALTDGWASSLHTVPVRRAGSRRDRTTTLVLKRYAPDAGGRAHAVREWRALTRLRRAGLAVPRALHVETDARHLGRPFVVMEHVPGTSLQHAHEAADAAGRARLEREFVGRLVALHALDPRLLDPDAGRSRPHDHLDRELRRLRHDSADPALDPALEDVVRWLEDGGRAVACGRPVILHRDFHPWNVLVGTADRLWVLDWDWGVGDARFDLAWTCTLLSRSGFPGLGGAVREEYARQSGRPCDDLAYFEVLTTTRWLLNVLPAVGPGSRLDAAARREFREFLVDPVRRARELLRARTGLDRLTLPVIGD